MALAGIALALVILCVGAVRQAMSLGEAIRGRERLGLEQYARTFARELAYAIVQEEAEVLDQLDLASREDLVRSLGEIEVSHPGLACFAILENEASLYPPEGSNRAGVEDLLAVLAAKSGDLLDYITPAGRARICLPHAGFPFVATLHRLRIDASQGAIGLRWSAEGVRHWCETAAKLAVPAGHAIEVLDPSETPLFRSAGSGRTDAEGARAASFPLGPGLFPWVARVAPSDAPGVQGMVRAQVGLFVGMLALLIGFILAGVWTLVNVAMEEMEVGRLKADFAANVSHELRTPLALIRAAADALGMRKDLDRPRLERYLGIIARQSQRLQDLINTVLAFARIERGERALSLERGDLGAFVTGFVRDFHLRLDEGGFRVECAVPDGPVPVRMDADSMHLVLVNLVENAMKFSGESRRIELRVEADAATARVRVKDFGIGIAPEDQKRIFDGFYRAERDLVKKTRGTGIGLALVRDVVGLHGGRVEVESALGQGATFTVSLPGLAASDADPA